MKRHLQRLAIFLFLVGTLFGQVNFEPAVRKNVVAQRGNGTRYADAFGSTSSNGGARIALAIADIASEGTVDARGLIGSQTITTALNFGSKRIRLILGSAIYTYAGSGAAIVMAAGSVVEGAGRGATIIHVTSNADGITPNTNALIQNLSLRGAGGAASGYSSVDGCNCDDVTISNVEVYDWPSHGINTGGTSNAWSIGPNNYIHDNDASGVFAPSTSQGHRVFDNVFADNGANTVDINGRLAIVKGNYILRGGAAHPTDCSAIIVTSIGAAANSSGANIEGNTIDENECHGVWIRADNSGASDHHIIKNNVISATQSATGGGITIDLSVGASCGSTSYITVEGNSIFGGTGYGILQGGGAGTPCVATGNSFVNNSVIDNDVGGIVVAYGIAPRLLFNRVLDNTGGNIDTSGSTNPMDFCNQTSTAASLCTMGAGTLAFNTAQPASGAQITLTSATNTQLTLSSSGGGGRRPFSLLTTTDGNLSFYDDTVAAIRAAIDANGHFRMSNGFTVGATTAIIGPVLVGSATLDFVSTAAQTSRAMNVAVTGVGDGDICSIGVPAAVKGIDISWDCFVNGANNVSVQLNNYSASAKDPSSAVFRVLVTHF